MSNYDKNNLEGCWIIDGYDSDGKPILIWVSL